GELAALLDEPKPNVNLMLEMVLEGLIRGVGMDRAIFALLSVDRQQLRAKFVLAPDREQLKDSFVFPIAQRDANAFAYALGTGKTLWIGNPEGGPDEVRIDPKLQQLSGGAFFVMPLIVAGKAIGVIYADRGTSSRELDVALFGQFKLFGQQARLGLSFLKAGG
ncbi:MAG: GAF domain-containing protein, partial [Xanthomonadaceae bacterium]|nr:GAF domain-containing protein [Xanthomonadaceae bacterium]